MARRQSLNHQARATVVVHPNGQLLRVLSIQFDFRASLESYPQHQPQSQPVLDQVETSTLPLEQQGPALGFGLQSEKGRQLRRLEAVVKL